MLAPFSLVTTFIPVRRIVLAHCHPHHPHSQTTMATLSTAPQTACSCCGAASSSLKRCGRCHTVSYCSVDCQRNDWKAGHKTACTVSDGTAAMPVRGQPASGQERPPRAPRAPVPAGTPVSAEERVAPLLDELRTTMAGSDTRRLLVVELSELLTAEAGNKRVVSEFLDAEGPEIVYDISSCMRGNWMADAKNGTMSRRSGRVTVPSWQCHSSLPRPPGAGSPGTWLRCALGASHRAAQGPTGGCGAALEARPRSPTLRPSTPRLSNLGSIPGPLGLAVCGYRNQVDAKVEKAAAGDHTGHEHGANPLAGI